MQHFHPSVSDALHVSLKSAVIPQFIDGRTARRQVKWPILLGRSCVGLEKDLAGKLGTMARSAPPSLQLFSAAQFQQQQKPLCARGGSREEEREQTTEISECDLP